MKICPDCQSPCFDTDRSCSSCGKSFSDGTMDAPGSRGSADALAVTERVQEVSAPEARAADSAALGQTGQANSDGVAAEEDDDALNFEILGDTRPPPEPRPARPVDLGKQLGDALHEVVDSFNVAMSEEQRLNASDRHVAKANREMWRRIEDSERVPSRCSWEWLTTQKALARQAVRENPGKMDARLAEVLFSNWTPVVLALGSFVTAFGVSFLGSLTFMGVDKAPLVGCLALGLMSAVIPLIGWWWIPAFVIKSVFGIGNASVKKAIREKEKAQELEEQRKRHEEWKKQQEAKSKGQ